MTILPEKSIRVTTAQWFFSGYIVLSSLAIGLHLAMAWSGGAAVNLLVLLLLGSIGAANGLSLWWLRRSLSRALHLSTWTAMFCVYAMVLDDLVRERETSMSIVFTLFVNVLALGLILGFKPALRYATGMTVILLVIGVVYHRLDRAFPYMATAYGIALPAKLVELLIAENTARLSRINAELQASRERFRALFEHAPVCVFEVDIRVTPPIILRANRQAERVYGWTAAEFSGLPATQVVPPDYLAVLEQAVAALRTEQTITLEAVSMRRDGTEFPARVSAAAEDVGDIERVIFTVEDVTAEQALRSEEEAITAERQRIAREIHDGVAQDLAALHLSVDVWHVLVDSDAPRMHVELERVKGVLGAKMREVRRSIFALRPVALDELGLYAALAQLTRDFGAQNQLEIALGMPEARPNLPPLLELVLFRIVQEALHNVSKHARAGRVEIALNAEAGDSVKLRVRDDGVGFDPATLAQAAHTGHLGVTQMRERVARLGGTFVLHSAVGAGTEIEVMLPVASSFAA